MGNTRPKTETAREPAQGSSTFFNGIYLLDLVVGERRADTLVTTAPEQAALERGHKQKSSSTAQHHEQQ